MGFPRQEYWSGLPFPSTGGSSQARECHVFCIGRRIPYHWATREAHVSGIHTLNCLLWTSKGILGHAIQLSHPDTIQIVHRHTRVYMYILCVYMCFLCIYVHTHMYVYVRTSCSCTDTEKTAPYGLCELLPKLQIRLNPYLIICVFLWNVINTLD